MMKQVVFLQSMEDYGKANIHTAACEGLCEGLFNTGCGNALKEAAACGKPILGQLVRDCTLWEVPMLDHGKSVRRKGWQR